MIDLFIKRFEGGTFSGERHTVLAWYITDQGDLYLTKPDGVRKVIASGRWVEVDSVPTPEEAP